MVKKHFDEAKVKVKEITKECVFVVRALAKIAVPILAIVNSIMELLEKRK